MVADDLDGVLVGAHGAVAAETPELDLDRALSGSVGCRLLRQGEISHIVVDADGEVDLGLVLLQLLVDSEDGGGRGILGAEAVAAADDLDVGLTGSGQSGDDVQIQRLTQSAGLLGAVEDGNLFHRLGNGGEQPLSGEGTIQMDVDHAHLLAAGDLVVHDLAGDIVDGADGNDDVLRVGSAVVVEGGVVGAQLLVNEGEVLIHHGGQSVIELVAGLTVLEEGVVILVGATGDAVVGVQSVVTEGLNGVLIHHLGQILVVPDGELLDLVGGTEAVEEVQEGYTTLNGSQMGHRSQVHDLLGVGLGQHGKAGLAAGHDVLVIAEDVQGVGGQGTGGHVQDAGQQLAGDLVEVRDHQQQSLRGGVGGGQSAGSQRAVDRTGSAGLGLHLNDLDGVAEDVLLALSGPLIHVVSHRAGRGDGVDAGNLSECIGYPCSCVVGVHGFLFSNNHVWTPP